MRTALEVIESEPLGIVRMRGADAVKFLQGQLSNDVARLSAERSLLAGYHNPQGRTIALIRLVQWDTDDILAVVPRELATVVASRLAKFVLRAKVKVVEESAAWRVSGLVGATAPGVSGLGGAASAGAGAGLTTSDAIAMAASAAAAAGPVGVSPAAVASTIVAAASDAAASGAAAADASTSSAVAADAHGELAALELPAPVGTQARGEGAVYVCVGEQPSRWLVISPMDGPSPVLDYPVGNLETWQRLEVAAGQPQVYAATSEEFVAQMLNLDALNAIAFDKGCYTGQEVIARAHYRGRVKRRMQRFVSREPCRLSPGDSGQLADGRTFKVVQAAQLADGRCDFLAVAPLVGPVSEPGEASPQLASGAGVSVVAESGSGARTVGLPTQSVHPAAPSRPGSPANHPPAAGASVSATLAADQATLPYPLPD